MSSPYGRTDGKRSHLMPLTPDRHGHDKVKIEIILMCEIPLFPFIFDLTVLLSQ